MSTISTEQIYTANVWALNAIERDYGALVASLSRGQGKDQAEFAGRTERTPRRGQLRKSIARRNRFIGKLS